MATKYILDAHALVWYLEGNPRLGKRARAIMEAAENRFILPLIALAEIAILIERGRISIPTVADLLADIQADQRIEIYPLTWEIFQRSLTTEGLKIPEMHDRFIVSTGLYLQDLGNDISIVTKDETIVASDVLSVLW